MKITVDSDFRRRDSLQVVASIQGVKPEERERLIAAATAGDRAARLQLMEMAPHIPAVDPITGGPTPMMPHEALSRAYIYEDLT